jgi:muramoyltetrapeptide carboxypeptidase
MMQNLKRSGKLARAKAVVVGYFNKMKFEKEWGADAEALINAYTASLGVPVIFGFPAGHASPNMSLYMGRRVSVVVTPEGAALEFL